MRGKYRISFYSPRKYITGTDMSDRGWSGIAWIDQQHELNFLTTDQTTEHRVADGGVG